VTGLKIGYARVSTDAQDLTAQRDACRAGDTLVVTKLDRLPRSLPDACAIADELTAGQLRQFWAYLNCSRFLSAAPIMGPLSSGTPARPLTCSRLVAYIQAANRLHVRGGVRWTRCSRRWPMPAAAGCSTA
jgi:hypothetical protein